MKAFTSQWQPIRHYSSLSEIDEVPGIYIWGFLNNSRFMPYYVGKAWNIGNRLCEHLSGIKGGSYRIYRFVDLFDIKNRQPFYLPDSIENRKQFAADEFNNSLIPGSIKEHTLKMIEGFHFTYVEMTNSEFDQHSRLAERAILNKFKNTIINSLIGRPEDEFVVGNIDFYDEIYIRILNNQISV